MSTKGYQVPPQFLPNEAEHRRQLAQALALVMQGKMNATSEVTLTPNATSTTIVDARIGSNTWIGLSPLTANAAAAHSSVYVSSQQKGQATLTHASSPNSDQTFNVLMIA